MIEKLGRYRILEKLGEGTLGSVYKAADDILGGTVAIRTIGEGIRWSPTEKSRFHGEYKSIATLQHPNIVAVHNFGEDNGITYVVMELLQGKNLRTLFIENLKSSVEDKLSMMVQIVEGFKHAHRNGILHRDVKPNKIYVEPDGTVKILDFGIAHLLRPYMTRPRVRFGAPIYLSPEQVRGTSYDERSDVFSVGIVFYELITGTHPFHDKDGNKALDNILYKSLLTAPEQLPDVPPGMSSILSRCLEKEPEARYKSMTDLARDCGEALEEITEDSEFMQIELQMALPRLKKAVARPGASPELTQLLKGIQSVVNSEEKTDYASLNRLMSALCEQHPTIKAASKAPPPVSLVAGSSNASFDSPASSDDDSDEDDSDESLVECTDATLQPSPEPADHMTASSANGPAGDFGGTGELQEAILASFLESSRTHESSIAETGRSWKASPISQVLDVVGEQQDRAQHSPLEVTAGRTGPPSPVSEIAPEPAAEKARAQRPLACWPEAEDTNRVGRTEKPSEQAAADVGRPPWQDDGMPRVWRLRNPVSEEQQARDYPEERESGPPKSDNTLGLTSRSSGTPSGWPAERSVVRDPVASGTGSNRFKHADKTENIPQPAAAVLCGPKQSIGMAAGRQAERPALPRQMVAAPEPNRTAGPESAQSPQSAPDQAVTSEDPARRSSFGTAPARWVKDLRARIARSRDLAQYVIWTCIIILLLSLLINVAYKIRGAFPFGTRASQEQSSNASRDASSQPADEQGSTDSAAAASTNDKATTADVLLKEARKLAEQGRYEEGKVLIRRILEIYPTSQPATAALAQFDAEAASLRHSRQEGEIRSLLAAASTLIRSGDLQGAKSKIDKAESLHPNLSQTAAIRRRWEAKNSEMSQDLARRQAEQIEAATDQMRVRQVEELFRQGKYPAAQSAVDQWLTENPKSSQAREWRVKTGEAQRIAQNFNSALGEKRYNEALNSLAKLEQANPSDPTVSELRRQVEAKKAVAKATLTVYRLGEPAVLMLDGQPVGRNGEVEDESIGAGNHILAVRGKDGFHLEQSREFYDGQKVSLVYDTAKPALRAMSDADRDTVKRRRAVELVHRLAVEHYHGVFRGSCKGELLVSYLEVEYRSSNGSHGFRLPFKDLKLRVRGKSIDLLYASDEKEFQSFRAPDENGATDLKQLWDKLDTLGK
ncbi:MAG TPA: protein kinase [Acidobacteriota bacterium]|nr:protein kinase [Acidobacteriota bacterium]